MTPLEERFGVWKDRRSCGTCTACCFIFAVPAVPTRDYEWCQHCTPGVGCGIYDARPEDCRAFYCLWRMGFGGDIDRPDRHGVVMDLQVEGDQRVVRVWQPQQLQERKLKSALRMVAQMRDEFGMTTRFEAHGPRGR